jgi:acyl-phosphate glycerol 3-phosphate acyltransferase
METFRAVLPILVGYLLGSLPFGYFVVRLARGIDIRDYGSHNIGATNVLRVVGPIPALITLLADIGKGFVPVLLATLPFFQRHDLPGGPAPDPWIVIGAALAAIVGHAYSAWFYLRERRFARGKAVATGLGVLIGLVVTGQVAALALIAWLGIWLLVLGLPRLLQGRWGYVSLASVLSALSLPLLFAATHAHTAYVLFASLAAFFVLWKHKENLGRLADRTEPRFGERIPLVGHDQDEVACAFFIHAMSQDDWWQPRRFAWARPLEEAGMLSPSVLRRLVMYARPMKVDEIRGIETTDGRRARVYLIGVPWLPQQIKAHPRLAVRRAVQAARLAKELGASVFGLGAFWSVIGNKGEEVQAQAELPVTNGGALTAGTIRVAVPAILRRLAERGTPPSKARAAVVGANGVVGLGICRSIIAEVGALVMVGTDRDRLEKSAQHLRKRHPNTEVVTTTSLEALWTCDLIFSATSDPNPVIFPEHVRPGTLIYDLGRPADVDVAVKGVRGVEVIPGGTVRPPGRITGRIDLAFGSGQIPACMAETVIIALERAYERVSLGDGTHAENIEYFVRKAEELGFEVVDSASGDGVVSPRSGAEGEQGVGRADGATKDEEPFSLPVSPSPRLPLAERSERG